MFNKNKILSFLCAFVVLFSLCFTFIGCGGENKAPENGETDSNFSFYFNDTYGNNTLHTEIQKNYILDNYANVAAYADGTKELSKSDKVSIYWKSSYPVNYYIFKIGENENLDDAKEYVVKGEFIDLVNLKLNTKYYYKVVAVCDNQDYESQVFSFITENCFPRNLDIEGITNARDLGGYFLPDDKQVKQGMLYRSGRLNLSGTNETQVEITENGKNELVNELGLKSEIDLRGDKYERGNIDSSVLGESVNYYVVPMIWEISQGNLYTENKESIKLFFDYLADESNYPILFHCNIGTDRTGLLAYLVNGLLGANESDLYRDYLFSNFGKIGGSRVLSGVLSYANYIQNTFEGNSRSQKIYNALLDCGISGQNLDTVISLLTETKNNYVNDDTEQIADIDFEINAFDNILYAGNEITVSVDVGSNVEWFSTDIGVVKISAEGKITAVKEGNANIVARKYNYRREAEIKVYPYNAKIYDMGEEYFFKNDSPKLSLDLSSVDNYGVVESVKVGDRDCEEFELLNDILSIPSSYFLNNKIYGNKTVSIISKKLNGDVVEQINYIYKRITVITAKVSAADDIDSIGEIAKSEETDPLCWGGYFLFTDDIAYNKTYKSFMDWNTFNNNGKSFLYNTGKNVGFIGTIDGNGHNIDGFAVELGSTGLVGVLGTGGVIKDLSFTNAKIGGGSALICDTGDGLIENVYVDCIEQLQGWGAGSIQKSGVFFASKSSDNAVIKNCFVITDVSNVKLTSESLVSPLAIGTVNNIANLQNVFCIVKGEYANNDYNYLGTCVLGAGKYKNNKIVIPYENNKLYGAYSSKDELIAQRVDFTGWSSDFWVLKDGLPIPLSVKDIVDKKLYTVNHYLYKTTDENDGYYIYMTESKRGILDEYTEAQALSLYNYTAKSFTNTVIGEDTTINIYYNRDSMLIESAEYDAIRNYKWFNSTAVLTTDNSATELTNFYIAPLGSSSGSMVSGRDGHGKAVKFNIVGSRWVGMLLTAEQSAALANGGTLKFWAKADSETTVIQSGGGDDQTITIGTTWAEYTVPLSCYSNISASNVNGQQRYWIYTPGDCVIYIDDITVIVNM